ncbi:MAG TPA: hypothetical protein EYP24_04130 [bacterium (Candidatus Stahlbacteria)]|nr:hypothetical protein [Candidatus Stahlbacteria bacterium]
MRLRYLLAILLIFISVMVVRGKIGYDENEEIVDPKLTVLNRYLEGRDFRVVSIDPLVFEVDKKLITIEGPWPDEKIFEKVLKSRYSAVVIRFRNQLIIPRR